MLRTKDYADRVSAVLNRDDSRFGIESGPNGTYVGGERVEFDKFGRPGRVGGEEVRYDNNGRMISIGGKGV